MYPEPASTRADRLDVRSKLVVLVFLVITVSIVKDLVWSTVLFLTVVILCFAIGRGRMALAFSASYLAIMGLFVLVNLLPAHIGGTVGSFMLLTRTMMPAALFMAIFVTSTKIGDLTAALYSAHVPRAIVIPFAVALRFFPTLREEVSAVSASLRLRGLAPNPRNLITRPALMFESLIVPIMLRSAKIAEELAAAAVARGIDRPGAKTAYNKPALRAADVIAMILVAIACGALITLRLHEGIGGLR